MTGRYRRIRTRLWAERPFGGLNEGEKLVALYLLSGPPTNGAGCYRLSAGSASEDLGLSVDSFQRRLAAVLRAFQWRYDSTTRVLYIPEWLTENAPHNPNAVKALCAALDEIPDCALKNDALTTTRAVLAAKGESFLKPFVERFPEPFAEPTRNGLANDPVPDPVPVPRRAARELHRREHAAQTRQAVRQLMAQREKQPRAADEGDDDEANY